MSKQMKLKLTDFEQATLEQLVSYKISKNKGESEESVQIRIKQATESESLIKECILLCIKWNRKRILLGLKMYE